MKLVLEIPGPGEGDAPLHRVIERFPFTVGRGYDNDVILDDPYVGARQFSIARHEAGWILTDGGDVNPTHVNARALRGAALPLSSGDTVRAGMTTLRVFAADHPVGRALRVQKVNPFFRALTRPVNVWTCFVLGVASVVGWTHLSVWSEDQGLSLAGAGAFAALVVFVWAALWAVAGRMIRRRAYFLAHVAMMSLYLLLGSVGAWLCSVLEFLSSENVASQGAGYLLNGALLALLLYGSLSAATLMKSRKRMAAALFFAGGLFLGILGVGFAQGEKFSADPPYAARLVPFFGRYAPAQTAEDFLSGAAGVFASDTFAHPDDKKK